MNPTQPRARLGHAGKRSPSIGVDLDGTMAHYNGWAGEDHIGEPIEAVCARVRAALMAGMDVWVFTARMSHPERIPGRCESVVAQWTLRVFGRVLPVTGMKRIEFDEIWDGKAVGVGSNTGVGYVPHAETLWERLAP